ncbi:MAG: hypothetical protein Marn2KO_00890 [Marinobacter nauticus]
MNNFFKDDAEQRQDGNSNKNSFKNRHFGTLNTGGDKAAILNPLVAASKVSKLLGTGYTQI